MKYILYTHLLSMIYAIGIYIRLIQDYFLIKIMLCINSSYCLNDYECILNHCVNKHDDMDYNNKLILPIIGVIIYDHPSSHRIYFCIFILLILIGLINNIFSLMTFIRDRIRYTVCGVYLIIYSICSLILMILILTNIITVIFYGNYFVRLWACHGYPYLSLTMAYTSILISAAIAIEGILTNCFKFDKFRSRMQSLIISIFILLIVLISNLDKIFTRHLIRKKSGDFYCIFRKSPYQLSSKVFIYIYIIIPFLIHLICLITILSIRSKQKLFGKIFRYQNHFVPSFFIILCLFINGLYRFIIQFDLINSSEGIIRLHIIFLFLFYAPQILTYVIYVLSNDFYVREFYQIRFYRKLCCCFYNKRRHVQEFEVIHKLWPRRTSLETIKTISTLDDIYCESEIYKKNPM